MKKPKKETAVQPRIRVYHAGEVALGPGKIELLGYVEETGSLSEAARRMKMSYMKAWLLVQIMNKTFRKPLIQLNAAGRRAAGRASPKPAAKCWRSIAPCTRRVCARWTRPGNGCASC